jgi:hypothetical protein
MTLDKEFCVDRYATVNVLLTLSELSQESLITDQRQLLLFKQRMGTAVNIHPSKCARTRCHCGSWFRLVQLGPAKTAATHKARRNVWTNRIRSGIHRTSFGAG